MKDPLIYPKQVLKNFQASVTKISDIAENEGGIVAINGKNYAVFKKSATELIILASICTHMRCQIKWNSTQKTWDCPCHGSRFSVEGVVIQGPATKPLQRITLPTSPTPSTSSSA